MERESVLLNISQIISNTSNSTIRDKFLYLSTELSILWKHLEGVSLSMFGIFDLTVKLTVIRNRGKCRTASQEFI